ncbi:MAG: C1 family peptidase [Candidatus Buchananbacteria bacterium]
MVKAKAKIGSSTLIKTVVAVIVILAFAVGGYGLISRGLPAAVFNVKPQLLVTPPDKAKDQNCQAYTDQLSGQKVYQGCDINFSKLPELNTKSAEKSGLKAKILALPKERQQELNFQLQQTQAAVKASGQTWQAGWNVKSILSDEEKKQLVGLLGKPPKLPKSKGLAKTAATLPDFFDWRDVGGKNYITSVKDQAGCGSCWAFAADATFEGHIQAYYNNPDLMPDLAEQDLVSCAVPSPSDGVGGCQGAYDYQIKSIFKTYWSNTGNTSETCFPYTASDSSCGGKCLNWQNDVWKTSGYKAIALTDNIQENIFNIKQALIQYGPVEVGMAVYQDFFNYSNGVYYHKFGVLVGGHAVTIVGFGKEDSQDYWVVKNSWGPNWGENGYFKIFVGDSNIDSWFAFVADGPKSSTVIQSAICTDSDADGYCYWGLGSKPTSTVSYDASSTPIMTDICPTSCKTQAVEDCDDSKSAIFQNCGQSTQEIGSLTVNTNVGVAEVYVEKFNYVGYIFRGRTPVTFNLNAGTRNIKISKDGYEDYLTSVVISKDRQPVLNIKMQKIARISSPEQNDVLRLGSSLTIKGIAPARTDMQFNNFTIEYGIGNNPASWSNQGIKLSGDGKNPVNNLGLLATWDTLKINSTAANYYTIRLTINYSDKTITNDVKVFLDPTIKSGWPVEIPIPLDRAGQPTYSGFVQPVVADINSDGKKEVIVYLGGDPPKLYVYDFAGRLLPNFPIKVDINNGLDGYPSLPTVGDINNDGKNEIIIFSKGFDASCANPPKVMIYNYQGILLKSLPVGYENLFFQCQTFAISYPQLTLSDLNNDGRLEIIIFNGYAITILDNQGHTLSNWPKSFQPWEGTFWHFNTVAVGNLDQDKDWEIVAVNSYSPNINQRPAGNQGKIYAWNLDGSDVSGWPVETKGVSFSSPTIADINNDRKSEVLVGMIYDNSAADNYGLYVYEQNGRVLAGWPQLSNKVVWGNAVVGDFNNDKQLEIVASSRIINDLQWAPQDTWMFKANGSVMPGWPRQMCTTGGWSPTIADINNDGILDVIDNQGLLSYCSIYAWDFKGNSLSDFPKVTEGVVDTAAVVADLDNDGSLELIASNNSKEIGSFEYIDKNKIFVWELNNKNAKYTDSSLAWPMFGHDTYHTNNYIPPEEFCYTNQDCQSGYICQSLKCTASLFPTQCQDSDGPKNFYVKGKTYGNDGRGAKWLTDSCVTSAAVYDYTCMSNIKASANPLDVWTDISKCPHGCKDGACVCASNSECPGGYTCSKGSCVK